MLVLQRRIGESIHIGNDIIVTVNAVRNGGVRLGIIAPAEVRVDRNEVRRRILAELSGSPVCAASALQPQ